MRWRLFVTTGAMMVFLVACGNSGNANSGGEPTSTTKAAPTTSTSASTTSTSAPTTSTSASTTASVTVSTYQTGEPDAGFSTYDLYSGSCSTFVAVYTYSFMGFSQGPTPTRIPAGTVVQVGTTTRASAPLPGGVPYPSSSQGGVLRNSRYSFVSSQCG